CQEVIARAVPAALARGSAAGARGRGQAAYRLEGAPNELSGGYASRRPRWRGESGPWRRAGASPGALHMPMWPARPAPPNPPGHIVKCKALVAEAEAEAEAEQEQEQEQEQEH